MVDLKIGLLKETETIQYAAQELVKYLGKIDPSISCQIVTGEADVSLGILSQLSLRDDDVEDSMIEDVVDVKIQDLKGYIAGSNDRSVLMGVYEYLKSAGCMWVRPGDDGEYIPSFDMAHHSFTYRKKADISFRGQCIEGAVSFENVRDMILWMPKVNMNLFMLEMVVPYNYFSRWYKHECNTVKEDENLPYEKFCEFTLELEKIIKKCGLQLHSLGHGYLFEPFGVRYKSPKHHYEISEEGAKTIALVNGKREFKSGSPNFTQICMSNDKARLGLVDFLVHYLEEKTYIDFLHVWLSDSTNNHCECDNCRKKIPSDFYVQMLNELDAELTKRNMNTKIVFIMYTDTYWAPETTKIFNPERFIMTTAATGRDYAKPYCFDRTDEAVPDFKRNQYTPVKTFSTSLAFMDRWKNAFDGKRFLFQYRMYTDHYFDPGYMEIARCALLDIQSMQKEEFDGWMDDQTQRCFFPTGLPMAVMGEAGFDRSMDFDSFAGKYFQAAFGDDGEKALAYLDKITKEFNPRQIRTNDSIVAQDTAPGDEEVLTGIKNNPKAAQRFAAIPAIVDDFLGVINKNLSAVDPCHAKSWDLLHYHAEYCKQLAGVYQRYAEGDVAGAQDLLNDMVDYLSRIEDEIQPQFDLFLFQRRIKMILN